MPDLKRIRFVATNYAYLQGLKFVPLGVGVLLIVGWMQIGGRALAVPIAIGIVVMTAIWLTERYYERAVGRTRASLAYRLSDGGLALGGGALALAALWVDVYLRPPVSLLGLTCAVVILCDYVRMNWLAGGRFRSYALVMAVLVAVTSLLPLLGLRMWYTLFAVLAAMGVAAIVLGLLDHRLPMQAMRPAPEVSDGQPL